MDMIFFLMAKQLVMTNPAQWTTRKTMRMRRTTALAVRHGRVSLDRQGWSIEKNHTVNQLPSAKDAYDGRRMAMTCK